eukprot:4021415-Prymnesium_polylepis.1
MHAAGYFGARRGCTPSEGRHRCRSRSCRRRRCRGSRTLRAGAGRRACAPFEKKRVVLLLAAH